MVEKITALIFGLLALVLEVFISIKNPSIESLVAAAFSLVIVITMIVLLKREKVVTLVDNSPENGKRPIDKILKLSNELAPYVKEKDGKIYIKVIR